MGTMASAMAHELNQPLASILNYAAGLQRSLKESAHSESALAAAHDIERAAARASVIIKRLRTMASKGELQLQAVPLEECVREAAEMALTGAYLDVRIFIPLHLHVLADRVQLQQVFVNLLRNAVDAIDRDSGEIEIVAEAVDGNVQVRVSDNGPGIGAAAIDTIFDPFVSTKPGGMGIGLSISRTIIEAFGGRLDVQPAPAGGATFIVLLLEA